MEILKMDDVLKLNVNELNGDFIVFDLKDVIGILKHKLSDLKRIYTLKRPTAGEYRITEARGEIYELETSTFKMFNFVKKYPNMLKFEDANKMEEIMQIGDEMGFTGITIGASVRQIWQKDFGGYKFTNGKFNTLNMKDWSEKEWEFAEGSMAGGICLINPAYKGVILKDVKGDDFNSHYPSIARNFALPYGRGQFFENEEDYKNQATYNKAIYLIYIYDMKVNDDKIATFGIKDNDEIDYKNRLKDMQVYIWEEELEDLKKDYKIVYEVVRILAFKSRRGLFDGFIDYFYGLKSKLEKGVKREFCKLAINNLLGKFGTKRYMASEGENGELKVNENDKYYMPLFSYITAIGRLLLRYNIRLLDDVKRDFVYCDTDSIWHLGDAIYEVDDVKLGFLKAEHRVDVFISLGTKKYAYIENNEIKMTVSGYTGDAVEKIEEFKKGTILKNIVKKRYDDALPKYIIEDYKL